MDENSKIKWYFDALPEPTQRAFEYLAKQKWLETSDWYLAGGTALALQVGHRRSVDLDFFTVARKLDSTNILENVENKDWKTKINKDETIYGELFGAMISFIAYPFFIPKLPMLKYGSIKILAAKDIAIMKIIALSQRGKKRDFFDLYYCVHHIISLEESMESLKNQYPSVAHNYQHILKSLVYFTDAQDDPEPDLLIDLDWTTVKKYFEKEIPELTKKLLDI